MIDREKVIKELGSLRDICNAKSNMAIRKGKVVWAGYANTADDAIALLKEQEPVEPSTDVDTYVCPNYGHRLEHQCMLGDNVIFDELYNFCPACGKERSENERDHHRSA